MNPVGQKGMRYLEMMMANQAMTKQIAKDYGYTPRDHVKVFTLPKGEKGKKYGSFSYKPVSSKANRIKRSIDSLKGEMHRTENADLPRKEKAKKLDEMKQRLKVLNCQYTAENARTPRVGIIVLEEDV